MEKYDNKTVIVILGPTASGKTAVSVELAKMLNGEIISADSMQLYKYLDIGTAKPDMAERQDVKHYMLDEVEPDINFSVAMYQKKAEEYIDEIHNKGKLPIITGGTGLYITSLVNNIMFSESIGNDELREKLTNEALESGNESLHKKLTEIDPESANRIHQNDIKRTVRALEVYYHTGLKMSYHIEQSTKVPSKYNFKIYGLTMDREILYNRIDSRVEKMIEKGLIQEVKNLMKKGYNVNHNAMQGIGYKEIIWYFRGWLTLNEAINIIKKESRHYAKRQLTWFRRMKEVKWINVSECENKVEIANLIRNYIA
jgi:tRNA dimethylallyltransferase